MSFYCCIFFSSKPIHFENPKTWGFGHHETKLKKKLQISSKKETLKNTLQFCSEISSENAEPYLLCSNIMFYALGAIQLSQATKKMVGRSGVSTELIKN